MVEVADVLEHGVTVLERDGWCQGTLVDVSGRVCASGALGKSALELSGYDPTEYMSGRRPIPQTVSLLWGRSISAVDQHIGLETAEWIPGWNDVPERTEFDVIDAFKATAKDLRNEAAL